MYVHYSALYENNYLCQLLQHSDLLPCGRTIGNSGYIDPIWAGTGAVMQLEGQPNNQSRCGVSFQLNIRR